MPSVGKFVLQLLFCSICEDFTFYWSHRMLHTKWLYQHVHKIHHRHINTVFVASQSAHPLEFVFGNIVPAAVGVLILGPKMHFVTVIGWFIVRNLETLDGHCGYEFSWSPFRVLPFKTGYGYHVYHHSFNIGNFCSFFHFWDTFSGTNKSYKEFLKEYQSIKSD